MIPTVGLGHLKKVDIWINKTGLAPLITEPPPTSSTTLLIFLRKKEKNITCDRWHMTVDTWKLTCDTRHVTRDTWHLTCLGGWTFSQNFSSLALTVCDLWYYEDLEEKAHLPNEWINHEAVYRTAPATRGLLMIHVQASVAKLNIGSL